MPPHRNQFQHPPTKRVRRIQRPKPYPRATGIESPDFDIDDNPKSATLSVIPTQGETLDYVEIYSDDGGNLGDLVAVMWFDEGNSTEQLEVWRADDLDFIEGHPAPSTPYHAVLYITAYYTDTVGSSTYKDEKTKKKEKP